ncbi:zinc finger protein 593-like [Stylophora pistillata]|uniref:zinc finger protein 593-like n=1 Tax=Stylophora pistillata TaxID=50429 RepID=UPI000C048B73|nr:zinc finger protein 593-like [Stylophora pistillata]
MGRLRRKRMHKNDKHLKKKYRTRRRTKDLDQIHEDMQPMNAAKLKSQECDMDLPGAGRYYCIQCTSGQWIKARCHCGNGVSIVHKLIVPPSVEIKLMLDPSFLHGCVHFACQGTSRKKETCNTYAYLFTVRIFRVKMLREVPYTTEEAERAAGMGSYTLTSTKPQLPVNEDEEMTNTERADRLAPNHLVIMK